MNVIGTENLLKASRANKVKKLIFYSTVSVHGKDTNFHGDEFSNCDPKSIYAKTKYMAKQLVLNSNKNARILSYPSLGRCDHDLGGR